MLITSKHPFMLISQDIAEICKPLELLNICHFTYQKHFDSNDRINLSNKPNWIADYYNLNLMKDSLFEAKPSLYQPMHYIWLENYDLDVYRHGKLYYNTDQSISIVQPQKNGCEFFLFSADVNDRNAIPYLARNIDLLYHFIFYFKDRADKLLKKAEKNKISFYDLYKQQILPSLISNLHNDDEKKIHKKNAFLQLTSIHQFVFEFGEFQGVKLTARELGCLKHFMCGETNADIATSMNLSRRTVEHYIDNVKNKFNCDTKSTLYATLKKQKVLVDLLNHQLAAEEV